MTESPALSPLVELAGLHKHFPLPSSFLARHKPVLKAVNGVSFAIRRGEAFCLVGESGCGKTTTGRMVMNLLAPSAGEIRFEGQRIDGMSQRALQPYRRRMQMIFQNPHASLNPRMTVRQTLEEPLRFHRPDLSRAGRWETVERVMRSVGNDPGWAGRYPHEFSGGQRQRIAIARALMVDPDFIVADEPVSALDVSIQAQVLNVLMDARAARGLTYLFITHDLSVVRHFGDRVGVMYLGALCETASTAALFARPRHPYTQLLLRSIPRLDGQPVEAARAADDVPTPVDLPQGCVFQTRCPLAEARCRTETPVLRDQGADHHVACHAVEEGRA